MVEICIKRKEKRNRNLYFNFTSKIIDHIGEVSPIKLNKGDTLEVVWDIEIGVEIEGIMAKKEELNFKKIFAMTEPKLIRYIRFVKYEDKVKVFLYKNLPKKLVERYSKLLAK